MQQVQQSSFEAPDLATVQWFLRDRDFDVEETVSKLTKYLVWRAECRPQQLSGQDVAGEAATGKAYLHEHTDVYDRPVIVIRARLHVTGAICVTRTVGEWVCKSAILQHVEALLRQRTKWEEGSWQHECAGV